MLGILDTLTRANGATTSYSYDDADRLLQSSTVVSGTTVGCIRIWREPAGAAHGGN